MRSNIYVNNPIYTTYHKGKTRSKNQYWPNNQLTKSKIKQVKIGSCAACPSAYTYTGRPYGSCP